MNIQASMIAGVIGIAMVASIGLFVKSQVDARIEAEVLASAEKTRADLSELQLERMEDQLGNERERQLQLVQDLQAARDVEAQATEVLEDRERLNTLTQAKPGLIERHARKATTKVWSTIEAESRE